MDLYTLDIVRCPEARANECQLWTLNIRDSEMSSCFAVHALEYFEACLFDCLTSDSAATDLFGYQFSVNTIESRGPICGFMQSVTHCVIHPPKVVTCPINRRLMHSTKDRVTTRRVILHRVYDVMVRTVKVDCVFALMNWWWWSITVYFI
jgi:hypothetical protein